MCEADECARNTAKELDKVLQQKCAAKDALRKEQKAHANTKEWVSGRMEKVAEELTELVGEVDLPSRVTSLFVERTNHIKSIAGNLK